MRRILARADLIATVSAFTKSRMLELFPVERPERVVVVGNGGCEHFSDEPRPSDEGVLKKYGLVSLRYVVCPASLTWRKSGDVILEVAREARAGQAGLVFVVIGCRHEAPLLALLGSLKSRLPDLPISLLGYVPQEDLATLYRCAFATLFLSRYEGFGIPVVEALASGCPLFISDQPALIEAGEGRAVVVESRAENILAALGSEAARVRPTARTGRTWARCAGRLVEAMSRPGMPSVAGLNANPN